MNADTLNSLIAEWARNDARMPASYAAPAAVLEERIAAVHYHTVERLAACARADAYLDRQGGSHTYVVSFRDNRDSASYNAACHALAVSLKRIGCRTTVRKPSAEWSLCTLRVTLPSDITTDAAQAHPLYLALLKTERARLERRAA